MGVTEPGALVTELAGHNRRPEVQQALKRFSDMERLTAEDFADAIGYMVTRPRHVAVNEMLMRSTGHEQLPAGSAGQLILHRPPREGTMDRWRSSS